MHQYQKSIIITLIICICPVPPIWLAWIEVKLTPRVIRSNGSPLTNTQPCQCPHLKEYQIPINDLHLSMSSDKQSAIQISQHYVSEYFKSIKNCRYMAGTQVDELSRMKTVPNISITKPSCISQSALPWYPPTNLSTAPVTKITSN
jgi:hypothetical protein